MFEDRPDPADYCIVDSSPESRLSQFERLTLTGGAELDRALSWIAKQLSTFSYQYPATTIDIQAVFSSIEFYTRSPQALSCWSRRPEEFFQAPTATPVVTESVFHGLADGTVLDISFDSSYAPRNPAFLPEFNSRPENKKVHARVWRHEGSGRPTIVAIHGWTMGDQRINSLAFMPGLFYKLGFDVALIELPYHGRRKPRDGGDLDGFLFPSMDITRTNEAMGQAISDLRNLRSYLQCRGAGPVGCIGMSLGAYVGCLWAALDELAFCVPIVPMISMAEVAWEVLTRDAQFKPVLDAGLTLDQLRGAFQFHCPLSYVPRTGKDRLLVIAGIGDRIVPPRQPRLLWDHWKRPQLLWFRGGHVAQFKRSQAFGEVLRFFSGLGFTPASPT